MKVVIEKNKEVVDWNKSQLLINTSNGAIVLYEGVDRFDDSGDFDGVILGGEGFKVGCHSVFDKSCFTPFKESITLSND